METPSDASCTLCGNHRANKLHVVREMMFGTRDEFTYIECSDCQAIQLTSLPDDLGTYYPADYYSLGEINLSSWPVRRLKQLRYALFRLTNMNIFKHYHYGDWLEKLALPLDSSILDLGCGNGQLLYELFPCGHTNLVGMDPFMEKSQRINQHIRLLKKSIYEVEEKFDCIMMHHSFEHMDQPKAVIDRAVELLNPNGKLLIRIPVAQKAAWKTYGTDWVQLDAPRHLFIHSETSLKKLTEDTGLRLDRIIYDSTAFQFTGSEMYRRNIPFHQSNEAAIFTAEERQEFRVKAQVLNQQQEGDQACFYFSKRQDKQ